MDAILYVDRTGIAWRYMPHDFPPWETVYGYFAAWQNEGVFDQLNGLLRRLVREAEGRDGEPRAFLFGLGDQIVGAVAFDIAGGKIATVRGIAVSCASLASPKPGGSHKPDTPFITQWCPDADRGRAQHPC